MKKTTSFANAVNAQMEEDFAPLEALFQAHREI